MMTSQVSRASEMIALGSALVEQLAVVDELRRDVDRERILRVSLFGGFSFDVLLDHGMDIGQTWFAGLPVAWAPPYPPAIRGLGSRDDLWQSRWSGGLVSTCGPDNIGAPRRGSGQNGTHHSSAASGVRWRREVIDDVVTVIIEGEVRHFELFGPRLTVHREIRATTDAGRLEIRDRVVNEGIHATELDYLYHTNIGAPGFHPGSTIVSDCLEPKPVGGDLGKVVSARIAPAPADYEASVVFDHGLAGDSNLVRVMQVSSPALELSVAWSAGSLPRLYQWVWASRGGWALGIEPASASLVGADNERVSEVLQSGEERWFSISVTCAQPKTGAIV